MEKTKQVLENDGKDWNDGEDEPEQHRWTHFFDFNLFFKNKGKDYEYLAGNCAN